MIYFDDLPLDKDILVALGELRINYVFQPIFQADGKTIFAREALMRPVDMSVMELIEEYTKEDRLLTAVNKWLIAHEDAKIDGAFNGLVGENITI